MNELIAAFTTPYTMQSVNLMLTYTECYACIALFARRFERRDFFLVPYRIITLRVVRRLWTSRFFGVKSKANTTMDSR